MNIIYVIAKGIFNIYYFIFFRLKVIGKENLPKRGAAIICSNHISNFDPITIAISTKRLPCFMAKKELFNNKLLGWTLNALDAFPVDRDKTDMEAYRTTMSKLKSGKIIGIFAQGTRIQEGETKAAKAGVALFATKSGAPIIPAAIITDYKTFGKIRMVFGKPISMEEYKGKKISKDMLEEIAENAMQKSRDLMTGYI